MERLVRRAQEGDAEAFVRLIEDNRQAMYKVAICYLKNTEDVADVIQDTVLSAYEKLTDLKYAKYFKTWLIRILINRCKNFLLYRAREQVCEELPETEYMQDYEQRIVYRELFQALDDKYRDILILYYGKGFKTKEIARILDMNDATVRTRLRRGRTELQILMEQEGNLERRPI